MAQAEAWSWFIETGRRIQSERGAALAELAALFGAGAPSLHINGPTRGALVGFAVHPAFDRAMAALTTLWLPWAGKRFDIRTGRGENLILRSARVPARVLWPGYSLRNAGSTLAGFEFVTRIEPSAVDAERDVLVIDYAPVQSNPALIIKQIRDELVEIVPGAHLGKMLWRFGRGPHARHYLMAYFALKSALPAGEV